MNRIDPALKFAGLVFLTVILAWKYSLILNTIVFIACFGAIIASRVPVKRLLILLIPVLLAAAGMFFTGYRFSSASAMPVNEAIFRPGSSAMINGLTQAARVLAYAGVGCLFALTTDRVHMVRSFQKRFRLPQVFSYGLLAAWGIFPHMLREFKRTRAAFRARGLSGFPLSPAVLKPLLVKSVRWSEALSVAMESRGFNGKSARTEFDPPRVQAGDWVFLGCIACISAIAAIVL